MGRARSSQESTPDRATGEAAAGDATVTDGAPERSGHADGPGATPTPDAPAASFEASAERLGAIVRELESGDLPLEQSLELFEEGVRVARAAQRRLDAAERRVEELLGVDDSGDPVTRHLDG